MLGVSGRPRVELIGGKNKLLPIVKYGLKLMSIGFLVDSNEAVVWRGPMAASALKQFMADVEWGELDFLIYDMPPGTGDVQLTLTQTIPLTGAVIITTPQDISIADARKGAKMFQKVNVPVLGIIENMSYYNNPDGTKEYIFGQGGGEKLSNELGVSFLGEIALNTEIRKGGDEGNPVVLRNPESEESVRFVNIARNLSEIAKESSNKVNVQPLIEL
jgi:ATP-binding protein involved in chromosome partitioning